ncbi:hypothetical protein MRB53_037939 [Persea americana]|nr:hypothetical protein MRB53_037939 [Persea americana]
MRTIREGALPKHMTEQLGSLNCFEGPLIRSLSQNKYDTPDERRIDGREKVWNRYDATTIEAWCQKAFELTHGTFSWRLEPSLIQRQGVASMVVACGERSRPDRTKRRSTEDRMRHEDELACATGAAQMVRASRWQRSWSTRDAAARLPTHEGGTCCRAVAACGSAQVYWECGVHRSLLSTALSACLVDLFGDISRSSLQSQFYAPS